MKYGFQEYRPAEILRDHLNLGGKAPNGEEIAVNSLYFQRGGKPWLGVMGEFHFCRYRREDWYGELCKMKAGGISIVSTYLFWIYHEEIEGEFDFTGGRDVRLFVTLCQKAGLDVVLRVGPWAHGECRNGGFPDWLLKKGCRLRRNDPGYLSKVKIWFRKIAEQVQGLFYQDGGNIIAIQLENELTNGADHLLALKNLALETGLKAPLYTVTGWNSAAGAKIPVDEVVPVFGGYVDLPWSEGTAPLPLSPHYHFSPIRNETSIGSDLIGTAAPDGWRLPYERYPYATCELGPGIQATHHRRPLISGMDAYAFSLVKLGSGNNLVGYYMYHGGTNKIGRLSTFQESRATGYPNDYPILSYDFQAPLSEYGEVREQYRLLNLLHLFIHSFGEVLAPMESVFQAPEIGLDDTETLRYAMRTDGHSGFVFVNHYQRHGRLKDLYGVELCAAGVEFPPIDITGNVSFLLPFRMKLDGATLLYATAQPLCVVGGVYFFAAIPGIEPRFAFDHPERAPKIVTLSWDQARYARLLSGQLYVGDGCDIYEEDGEIKAVQNGSFQYDLWNGEGFTRTEVSREFRPAALSMEECGEPFAPPYLEELSIGGERKRTWKKLSVTGSEGFVEIVYEGDAAQIYADGELAADEYCLGRPWRIPASLLYGRECYLVVSEKKDDFCGE